MPALSPTMTEGSVSEWKFKEGESFVAGDVLLAIETDKAAIDVEAQDDGIMGKIVVPNGTSGVEVGKIIALLAEEGDDISNLVVPAPSASSSAPPPPTSAPAPPPTPKAETPAPKAASPAPPAPAATPSPAPTAHAHAHPTHPRPLLPSVLRLLSIAGIEDATVVVATGHKGMLTKGDVLAYLGEIPSPRGSEKAVEKHAEVKAEAPKKPLVEMDGASFRRLIAVGLGSPTTAPRASKAAPVSLGFDDVLDQYLPPGKRSSAKVAVKDAPIKKDSFDSVLGI
ncbi:hypothetical protein RQP46_010774 [Phenoliferia psychrophenolica]